MLVDYSLHLKCFTVQGLKILVPAVRFRPTAPVKSRGLGIPHPPFSLIVTISGNMVTFARFQRSRQISG